MADGRSAEETAATDLCDDSRVPRERHKNRVVEHHSTLSVIYRNNDQKCLYDATQRSNNSVISASEYLNNDNITINNNNNTEINDSSNNNNNNNNNSTNINNSVNDSSNDNNERSGKTRCIGGASDECNGDYNVVDDEEVENDDDDDEDEDDNNDNNDNNDDDDNDDEDEDEDEDEDDGDDGVEDEDEENNVVIRENKVNILKSVLMKNVPSVNINSNSIQPMVSSLSSSPSSPSSSLLHCKKDKLINEIECTRNIMLEKCMKMKNCNGEIVMLMEYSGSPNISGIIDDNIIDKKSIMKTTTSTAATTTTTRTTTSAMKNIMDTVVVDAAAAAVAVSAIPETMKEIHQHKQQSGNVVTRLSSPFKGQIRMAEDTLVGPCGKKRCADRYDSSESSDSGVAVSCGECSSSGTSDITEPGSPCSTSSDEGVAIRGTAPSPLPILPKLAPPTPPGQNGTRPQWPWTPPLATTACFTYKLSNGEPEAGTLPKSGAADPTARSGKTSGKIQLQHHHHYHNQHETQGKITEYFKTQIKPQQSKVKKTLADMSVLVTKSSPEFRRPPIVKRNKGGLAKYLGVVTPNGRIINDWEMRTTTISPPLTKKLPNATPRINVMKFDKILSVKTLPSLPITTDILTNIPGCKMTSLRLSDTNPKVNGVLPLSTPTMLANEPVPLMNFDNITKPIVNENNNITNTCMASSHVTNTKLQSSNNQQEHPLSRLSSSLLDTRERKDKETTVTRTADDDDEEEEEEEDSSRSSESKPSSSPILSAPTTIRFPARTPAKNGSRTTDSGICRWDKCDADFECSGALLEHLQAAHINTQTGGDNFVCHWQGCKVQGRTSCSRRWLERHVLSHGGNKPFRCIVDGCGSRFSSQTALERHVNNHFNQPETSNGSSKRSCENGGKLVRRNGKKLRYRRQPWSARLFDYFDTGVMEGLQHRLLELAKTRTQGQLAETPGTSMALTSQVLAKRVETDGKTKVLLRWHPQDLAPDEWVLESEVQKTKHIDIREAATTSIDEVTFVLYPAVNGGSPPSTRVKQRRKPAKNS